MSERLLFLSEDPKHVDEEIDEVEVEGERAEDSELHTFIGGVRVVGESDLADALRIISGEADEDQDACVGEDHFQERIIKEKIHHGSDDESEKPHEAQIAHLRKVSLRKVAIGRHDSEGACGDEEDARDRGHGVNKENGGHHRTVQDGIDDVHGGRFFERHAGNRRRKVPYEGDRRDEERPHREFAGEDQREQHRAACYGVSGEAGDGKGNSDPEIDVFHEAGHIDGEGFLPLPGHVVVERVHRKSPFKKIGSSGIRWNIHSCYYYSIYQLGDIETIEQPFAGRLPIAGELLIRERGPSGFPSSSQEEGGCTLGRGIL